MGTDAAEIYMDKKGFKDVSYDGASSQRCGINGLNAHPRKPVRGLGTNPGKANPSFGTKATIENVTNAMIKRIEKSNLSRRPNLQILFAILEASSTRGSKISLYKEVTYDPCRWVMRG